MNFHLRRDAEGQTPFMLAVNCRAYQAALILFDTIKRVANRECSTGPTTVPATGSSSSVLTTPATTTTATGSSATATVPGSSSTPAAATSGTATSAATGVTYFDQLETSTAAPTAAASASFSGATSSAANFDVNSIIDAAVVGPSTTAEEKLKNVMSAWFSKDAPSSTPSAGLTTTPTAPVITPIHSHVSGQSPASTSFASAKRSGDVEWLYPYATQQPVGSASYAASTSQQQPFDASKSKWLLWWY